MGDFGTFTASSTDFFIPQVWCRNLWEQLARQQEIALLGAYLADWKEEQKPKEIRII